MIKKKVSRMFKIGLIILCCIGILFIIMRYITYDKYWNKVGRTYEQMIQLMGEPNSVKENEGIRDVCYAEMTYVYVYDSKKSNRVYLVELEDKNVRFGLFNIGVGTPDYIIKFIYSQKDKIKDLDQYNYGIVDGSVNVVFEFDNHKKVKKIYLSDSLFTP